MINPCIPGLFSDRETSDWCAQDAVAPSSVTMAPAAIQSRRSGRARHTGQRQPTRSMLAYRDALRACQPATDHRVTACGGLALSAVNGRRNDWLALDPTCIDAVDRVQSEGYHVTRTRWRIRPGSIADTAEATS
jgi:hypothetical protein